MAAKCKIPGAAEEFSTSGRLKTYKAPRVSPQIMNSVPFTIDKHDTLALIGKWYCRSRVGRLELVVSQISNVQAFSPLVASAVKSNAVGH